MYQVEASTSFTDTLVTINSSGLQKKMDHKAKRKEMVKVQRELTKTVNDHFAEKATISMLTECESKRKYHRKRMAQSFCSPQEQPPAKKNKTHSPDFSNVTWDKEKLQETIQNWPVGTNINWSAVAKEHSIPGKNAGQVAKEFCERQEMDTSHIATPKRKHTMRPRKRKLPGCEVSIPSNPPISVVEAEIQSMISSGRFTLGEECAPYTITRYKLVNGVMTPYNIQVQGRKVPLTEIRQRLLQKQLQYMRLTPDSTVATMTRQELTKRLNMRCDDKSEEELRELLHRLERSRSLCMWHDHATILKRSFMMVTVHVLYDPVVFYTEEEYQLLKPGADVDIQAEVEQPEIHLIAAGSSTIEDQAALTGDRVSCLLDLSQPVRMDDGAEITDTLRFFTGDHPAAQFEQGTKQGGIFKCGMCGCQDHLFDDQAHALHHKWRSLQQLQTLATGGRFGRQAGILQPFDLKVKELRTELEARGVVLENKPLRVDLQKFLDEILRGVMRVPALLLTNPTQPLASLNLERYEIVASEPLHDIKGHVINLITELPNVLPQGETANKCKLLIDHCLAKEKKSGADIRRVAIQIYLLLKDLDVSSKVLFLLQSVIKIGEIAYSHDNKRSPRQLLQLYNMCWMHMELCRDLLSTPAKISKGKMFGHYSHAMTAHLPTQLELACLRSLNTESQERLFGQARGIAEACTNHHPDNIIPHVMLRLQVKQEQHEVLTSVQKGESQVSHVAKDMPQLPATKVKMSFILQREDSWQMHLKRISPFLIAGVDVWWSYMPNGFVFHDGDTDSSNPGETFSLLHHRCHSIMDVEQRRDTCWKRIVDDQMVIPAKTIKLYDSEGNKTGRLLYSNRTVTLEHTSTDIAGTSPESWDDGAPFEDEIGPVADPTEVLGTQQDSVEDEVSGAPGNLDPYSKTTPPVNNPPASEMSFSGPDSASGVSTGSSAPCTSFMNLNLEQHEEGLKTSVGNSIKRLLGCDVDLVEFDELRFKLKEAQKTGQHKTMTASISRYSHLSAKIQAKVKSLQSSRAAELKELERKHLLQYGKIPAKTRGSHYYNILKERDLAMAILRNT